MFKAVVKTWVVNEDDLSCDDMLKLSDPVTYWTRIQDRGALLHVSAEFFQFMKILEEKVREVLNPQTLPNFANCDVVLDVGVRVQSNPDILTSFRSLVEKQLTSEELCHVLLDQVMTSWIASKARLVTNQYIFKLKDAKKGSVSKMGTPALRKTLDKH